MTRRGVTGALSALAAEQCGVFTKEQARKNGVSSGALLRSLAAREIVRLHRGVYCFRAAPRSRNRDYASALLWAGDGALLSHETAGAIWNFHGYDSPRADAPIHVTTPWTDLRPVEGVVLHRSRTLDRTHKRKWNNFWVTSPARTLMDLGEEMTPEVFEVVAESSLCRKQLYLFHLEALLKASRRGLVATTLLREFLESRRPSDGTLDSDFEVMFIKWLRRVGLPEPKAQYTVKLPGLTARVDFAYPRETIAIELQGYAKHFGLRPFNKDGARFSTLAAYGWCPQTITWDAFTNHRERVLSELKEALERRGPQLRMF